MHPELRTLLGLFAHPVRTLREVSSQRLNSFAILSPLYVVVLVALRQSNDCVELLFALLILLPPTALVVPAAAWVGCRAMRIFGKRLAVTGLLNLCGVACLPRILGGVALDMLQVGDPLLFVLTHSAPGLCAAVTFSYVGALCSAVALIVGLFVSPSKCRPNPNCSAQANAGATPAAASPSAERCLEKEQPPVGRASSPHLFWYSLGVSVLALSGFGFFQASCSSELFDRMVRSWLRESVQRQDVFQVALCSVGRFGSELFLTLTASTAAAAIVGLLSPVRSTLRSIARSLSTILSTVALVTFLMYAITALMTLLNLHARAGYDGDRYASILQEGALFEAAHGRLEDYLTRMSGTRHLTSTQLEKLAALPGYKKLAHARQIAMLLPVAHAREAKKRLLATAWQFRDQFTSRDRFSANVAEAILTAANAVGEEHFDTVEAFFAWLEPRLNTEGWEVLPLYAFEFVDPTLKTVSEPKPR